MEPSIESGRMKNFVRKHKLLAVSIAAVAGLILWSALWSVTASTRGEMFARYDIARGHYEVLGYGLPVAWRPEYVRLLQEQWTERRNGGAYLKVFQVGPDLVFDWFASRNRLWDERLLDWLVLHPTIAQSFPELLIPDSPRGEKGFGMFDPFLLDGTFASLLYHGGAYVCRR